MRRVSRARGSSRTPCREAERREEAVHAYRQAILRDPDFADAQCHLGLLLESLGRRQEALRHLSAARALSGPLE